MGPNSEALRFARLRLIGGTGDPPEMLWPAATKHQEKQAQLPA
jgi:hypothetical protein